LKQTPDERLINKKKKVRNTSKFPTDAEINRKA